MGIEQHLVSLLRIRPQHLRTAVAALELCDQQLLAFAADHGPVLAPVELKRLPRSKLQRYEWSATCTRRFLLMLPPRASKGTHPVVAAGIPQRDQITLQLAQVTPMLTASARFTLRPVRRTRYLRPSRDAAS